jgi:predicted Ser/Thr protein kinase
MSTSSAMEYFLASGNILRDRYEVGAFCGSGGMAKVYRGYDRLLGRPVAIKLLIHLHDMSMIERFEREAQILSQLNHPNIATIYDFGVEREQPFMVMEYVEGKSLDQLLSDDKPMDPEKAIPILLQMGEGLAAAHEHGVIHRDVKPENVLVSIKGDKSWVKLIDFGLAISHGPTPTRSRLTTHGHCVGTQRYMSPEQLEGKAPTPSTDIYAFGLVCAELLGGNQSIMGGRLLISEFPPHLRRFWPVIAKACRDYPSLRWSNMGEMLEALRKRINSTVFQKRMNRARNFCTNVARKAIGQPRNERNLALGSMILGLFLFLTWGYGNKGPQITLENVGISWLPKNQIRVRVMGMAERANPTQLFIETSIYDNKGELMPDPSSTIIDKTLSRMDALKIMNPLQSLDKDFQFKMPSIHTKGFIHVRIFDRAQSLIAEQKIPIVPPTKRV